MKKSYWIMIAILVILVAVYLLMTFVFNKDTTVSDLPEIDTPSKEEITTIKIRNGIEGELLTLTKSSEDKWELKYREEKPISDIADKNTVDNILKDIQDLKFVNVKTKNKEKYYTYEIDDNSAIFVDIITDREKRELRLIVGGTDINSKYTFVRLPEKDYVYSVFGNIRKNLNKKLDDFRDKTIFDYETDDIVKVEYTNSEGEKTILEKEEITVENDTEETSEENQEQEKDIAIEWKHSETKELYDTEEINKAVSQVSKLRAADFLDYPVDDDFPENPVFEVAYYENEASGKVYNLKVLKLVGGEGSEISSDEKYLVQNDNLKETLYLVNKSTIEHLMKLKDAKPSAEKEKEEASE